MELVAPKQKLDPCNGIVYTKHNNITSTCCTNNVALTGKTIFVLYMSLKRQRINKKFWTYANFWIVELFEWDNPFRSPSLFDNIARTHAHALGKRTFPNEMGRQGLGTMRPAALWFPGPDDSPIWEVCDFPMGMGSSFYPMTWKHVMQCSAWCFNQIHAWGHDADCDVTWLCQLSRRYVALLLPWWFYYDIIMYVHLLTTQLLGNRTFPHTLFPRWNALFMGQFPLQKRHLVYRTSWIYLVCVVQ